MDGRGLEVKLVRGQVGAEGGVALRQATDSAIDPGTDPGTDPASDPGTDPALSLAIDNCFATKRWTRPQDWMPVVQSLGLQLVEASADTECDPLYMGSDYMRDWIDDVKRSSERYGVRVANLYSGHGTYSTLGLAHTDRRVRERFREQWVKAQVDVAAALGAGLGFFAHAIHDGALQRPAEYGEAMATLEGDLAEVARYARNRELPAVSLEQMYSPHQPPWTIDGATALLRRVFALGKAPFYLTIDLGHMNGQQYFRRPSKERISQWIASRQAGTPCKGVWLGPASARSVFNLAVAGELEVHEAISQIEACMKGYDYLFASERDGSVHEWLSALGCYSPIIHLQQSDGKSSPHWPFSSEYNAKGIIKGQEVLHGLARAYLHVAQARQSQITDPSAQSPTSQSPASINITEGLPPPCDQIVLTLEPFISTSGNIYDLLDELAESVAYWRQFIPYDGIKLSDALKVSTRRTD